MTREADWQAALVWLRASQQQHTHAEWCALMLEAPKHTRVLSEIIQSILRENARRADVAKAAQAMKSESAVRQAQAEARGPPPLPQRDEPVIAESVSKARRSITGLFEAFDELERALKGEEPKTDPSTRYSQIKKT